MLHPWKFYMKPKNHPFARENHLPNIHYCIIVFQPLISRLYHMFPFTRFNAVSQGTVMDGNHQCSSRYMRSIKPRSRRHWKFECRRKLFFQLDKGCWNFGKWLHNSARIIWKDVFTGCSCSIKVCKLSQVSVIVSSSQVASSFTNDKILCSFGKCFSICFKEVDCLVSICFFLIRTLISIYVYPRTCCKTLLAPQLFHKSQANTILYTWCVIVQAEKVYTYIYIYA